MDLTVGFTCNCGPREVLRCARIGDLHSFPARIRRLWHAPDRRPPARAMEGIGEPIINIRGLTTDPVERARAIAKAKKLLRQYTTPSQQRSLKIRKWFSITGSDGRTYRIKEGTSHNVYWVRNNIELVRYCVVVAEQVPLADQMLAQKLILESDAETFKRLANMTVLKHYKDVVEEVKSYGKYEPPRHLLRTSSIRVGPDQEFDLVLDEDGRFLINRNAA